MTIKAIILFMSGATLFGVTFAAWYWLNALAAGMNPTGSSQFSLDWSDWEALRYFIPTFVIGIGLMIAGVWIGLTG